MEIKTERLILRELKEDDIDDIIELHNNKDVLKYMNSPFPYTLKEAKELTDSAKNKLKENYMLGMEYNDKIIGIVFLTQINKIQKNAFLHFTLGKKYWQKGLGYEAAKALLDFAFKDLGLKTIESNPIAENVASKKLLEKLCFKKNFLLPKHNKSGSTGETHDVQTYLLGREDWEKF